MASAPAPVLIPILRLVLGCFVVYRLAQLVALDDGPGAVFRLLREWAGRAASGAEVGSFRWSIAELLHCPYCLGVWFSLPVMALVMGGWWWGDALLLWLGLAGAQAFLQGDRK